jgi:hypothetical protein
MLFNECAYSTLKQSQNSIEHIAFPSTDHGLTMKLIRSTARHAIAGSYVEIALATTKPNCLATAQLRRALTPESRYETHIAECSLAITRNTLDITF